MGDEKEQWLGPAEAAERLGVTIKALRVYEREGLVVPHRDESNWRLYGPVQFARLHQIIVLRDLGLPLKSIKTLIGSQSRLRDVLRLQRQSLELQQDKIGRALDLIAAAQRQLDEGRDLSLDDLATLTKETVVQLSMDGLIKFAGEIQSSLAKRDPTGQATHAVEEFANELVSDLDEAARVELLAELGSTMAEARRLNEAGDVNSEAAKQLAWRWLSLTGSHTREVPHPELLADVYADVVAKAEATSEPLLIVPAIEFIGQIIQGMKARGELDGPLGMTESGRVDHEAQLTGAGGEAREKSVRPTDEREQRA